MTNKGQIIVGVSMIVGLAFAEYALSRPADGGGGDGGGGEQPNPNSLWKVGDILLLTSGEKWQILKVYPGSPVVYQAKWLDTGSIADVPEANFVASGAVLYNPPATVTVNLKCKNAPAGAAYWVVMCKWYQQQPFPFPGINSSIIWTNIPPDTPIYGGPSGSWGIMVTVYDANNNLISAPNTNTNLGFSTNFNNGWTYTWDFARGLWLDPNGNML